MLAIGTYTPCNAASAVAAPPATEPRLITKVLHRSFITIFVVAEQHSRFTEQGQMHSTPRKEKQAMMPAA
jgi:hypothetical protein